MQEYHGDITVIPRVGPKDFLRVLNNPNPKNMEEWIHRGRIMTYFKLEEIKASLYFENLLKSMIKQLDWSKDSSKELFENSVYTEIANSSRFIECSSGQKNMLRGGNGSFIKRNLSEEDIIETGGIFQNKSAFWGNNKESDIRQLKYRNDVKLIEPEESSKSNLIKFGTNADFYTNIVEQTQSLFRVHQENIKYERLIQKFT